MAEGSLPVGDVNDRSRATAPFEAAVPDDRVRESGPACPKAARAVIARINAIWLRVENLFIGSRIGFYRQQRVLITSDKSRGYSITAAWRQAKEG